MTANIEARRRLSDPAPSGQSMEGEGAANTEGKRRMEANAKESWIVCGGEKIGNFSWNSSGYAIYISYMPGYACF